MTRAELAAQVHLGEDSTRQFKVDVHSPESLAAELAAFANSSGGTVFIGVADDGSLVGLDGANVRRLNQLIANAASHLVRSPLVVHSENVAVGNDRLVIVVRVPAGLDKPYFDKNGVIWLRVGADKRRVNSKEELRRFFQLTHQIHADELPTRASVKDLDWPRFRTFFEKTYGQPLPDSAPDRLRLLQNLNLAGDDSHLNLAGLLLFAEHPERFLPALVVKAVRYPGVAIHENRYDDLEELAGPLPTIYAGALAFVLRNLHKVQAGSVNEPGVPEVPAAVFEELLVIALIHRDYLVSAPIRLFLYDDRIEIVSPGHLPNNLTVEKIRAGNSNLRNPVLASFAAKGLLPYAGLGSGVVRVLGLWSAVDFVDDRDACSFTATVWRPGSGKTRKSSVQTYSSSVEPGASSVQEDSPALLDLLTRSPTATIPELAAALAMSTRGVEKQLARLREQGRVHRVGPKKGGRWEVLR